MAGLDLTQAEADALISMEKQCVGSRTWTFPTPGDQLRVDLISPDRREKFLLTVNRRFINIAKRSYQTLARAVVVLVRLDYGAPDTNPDGERVPSPHLHRYREGYGDRWAEPISPRDFPHIGEPWRALTQDFMRYCNITKPPRIDRGLF